MLEPTTEISSTEQMVTNDENPVTDVSLSYGQCEAPCAGATRKIFNQKYQKWIKVVTCSTSQYDIFMGETESGPFFKIGDLAGHGQDHCELLNEDFTLPDER